MSVKSESVGEEKKNLGMNIISIWAKNKKIKINENKSKVVSISRRKTKGKKEIE